MRWNIGHVRLASGQLPDQPGIDGPEYNVSALGRSRAPST